MIDAPNLDRILSLVIYPYRQLMQSPTVVHCKVLKESFVISQALLTWICVSNLVCLLSLSAFRMQIGLDVPLLEGLPHAYLSFLVLIASVSRPRTRSTTEVEY